MLLSSFSLECRNVCRQRCPTVAMMTQTSSSPGLRLLKGNQHNGGDTCLSIKEMNPSSSHRGRRGRFSVVGRCLIFDHFLENDGDARNYETAFCNVGYDTRYLRNPSVKVRGRIRALNIPIQPAKRLARKWREANQPSAEVLAAAAACNWLYLAGVYRV